MLAYLDLARAWDFVNYSQGAQHHAWVNRETGKVRCLSELEPDLFDPWDEALAAAPWVPLPPRADLDPEPESALPIEFVAHFRPNELKSIAELFRHAGGRRRFIAWLERRGLDVLWYSYELSHTEGLLRQWCERQGIPLAD